MPAERRAGFSTLPMHCPHCARRLKQSSVVLHGGVLRCERCERLQYVILVGQVQLAYLVDIEPHEVIELSARGAAPHEVLQFLGVAVRAA